MHESDLQHGFEEEDSTDLRQFRGRSFKDVIEFFEDDELQEELCEQESELKEPERTSVFDGFLALLREKGVRVSTPEWLQFLKVIQAKSTPDELKKLVNTNELLARTRLFAQTTLVKDKADEAAFHEAFDEYFLLAAKIYHAELEKSKVTEEKGGGLPNNETEQSNELVAEEKDEVQSLGLDKISSEPVIEAIPEEEKEQREGEEPEIKEKLGIDEVEKNDKDSKEDHSDDEEQHGGKKDQHNDILKKEDIKKEGGGNKKDKPGGQGDKGDDGGGKGDKDKKAGEGKGDIGEKGEGKGDQGDAGAGKGDKGEESNLGGDGVRKPMKKIEDKKTPTHLAHFKQDEFDEEGFLIGGGEGSSLFASRVILDGEQSGIGDGVSAGLSSHELRQEHVQQFDRRQRYEIRPEKAHIKEIVRKLRRIILDTSETKSRSVDIKSTVNKFARREYRFNYEREVEKQQETVLFIDVGGPIDTWQSIIKDVSQEMTKGLSKLEVYFFHNNLYGYAWKADLKNPKSSGYAPQDSLIDIKQIVKKRKKVIIYGDANMSSDEFDSDLWPPKRNEKRIEKFKMKGPECLSYIKRHSEKAVWINPIFRKEWKDDNSHSIENAGKIIPMYDLTVGGVEDAVKELIKK